MTEAASMPTTASMDRENDTLLTHMRAFFDKIRISGINCGPSCFQSENFPSENCTVGDIVAWLQLAILTLIPYIITAEKNKRYRFGSKSERAIINQRNGFVKEANNKLEEHKKNNNTIYRSDYEKVTSDIKQELDKLNQTLLELAERSLNQNRQVDKCRKTIERLEELLKGYEKMTVIDDPEESSETPMSSETGSHTCDGTSDSPDQSDASSTSDDPDASGTSDNPDASSTSDAPDASGTSDAADASGTSDNPCNPKCNLFPVELEEKIPNSKEIDEEVQIIANNKEQKKNLSLENKMQDFNEIYLANKCNNLGYKNAKVCIINKVNAVDPITGTIISVNKAAYRSRTFEVLHENSKLIEKIMSETTLFRGKNGEEFELNPAANSELCLVDEDGNAIAMLDSQLLLNPDSPEHEALKNELNAQWQYDQSLLNVLTVENYRLLLSPIEFLGNPSLIYGMRPVFMRIGMSEELAIHLTVDAIMLLTSKGRITSKEDIINCGEFFSRQHVIEIINGLARVFNPLAELIREISLSIVKVWHNDETTFVCSEMLKSPDDDSHNLRSNNYIWGLVTGKHEEIQSVIYYASRTRSHEEFLNQMGDNLTSGRIAVEYIISDGYEGYPCGIKKLEESTDHKVNNACCYFHMRRYFLNVLDGMGIRDVFYEICTSNADDYQQNLNILLENNNIKIDPIGRAFLYITFLVEKLLLLDSDFSVIDRDSLEDRRERLSKPLYEELYKSMNRLVEYIPESEIITDKNGNSKFVSKITSTYTTAITYAINHKEEFSTFLKCGDVELTNNYAEFMLRDIARTRKSSLHFSSMDGFYGYANLMTIIKTCIVNGINPYIYLQWVLDNAKLRLEEYRLKDTSRESSSQICLLPKSQTIKENGKNIKISMYDKRFKCPFDKISWDSLDPWTYKKILMQEKMRLKNPLT